VEGAKCHGSSILSLDRDEIVAFTSGSQRCQIAIWQSQAESANLLDMCIALTDNKIVFAAKHEYSEIAFGSQPEAFSRFTRPYCESEDAILIAIGGG
jgi:hypothetical protein